MRRFAVALSVLIAATALPVFADDAQDSVDLLEEKDATVLVLDFKGGYGLPPKGPPIPDLVIKADGSVEFDARDGSPAQKANIEEKELQDLLKFVVVEKKFFDIDPKELAKQKQNGGGLGLFVADAATVEVKVKTADNEASVEIYAPGMTARQHPKIEGYQNFDAIRLKLLEVYSRLRKEHDAKAKP